MPLAITKRRAHPWLVKGWNESAHPRDEAGRFAAAHGAIADRLGWDAEDYRSAAELGAASLKKIAATAGVSVADLKAAIADRNMGKAEATPVPSIFSDDKALAAAIHEAGRSLEHAHGGPAADYPGWHVVYPTDLYAALKGRLPVGTSLDAFKARLADLHRGGHINALQLDLPQATRKNRTDPADILPGLGGNGVSHGMNGIRIPPPARPAAARKALDLSLPPAHPWLVKAMGRWNPNDHPRGQPGNAGEFANQSGGKKPKRAAKPKPHTAKPPAGYGSAGDGHPLVGMDRKAQTRRLADARPGIGDEPGNHLGIDEAGPPEGLDMAKFGTAAADFAARHFAEKSYGADMPEAYKAIGEPFGLSKYDFLRAITAAHNAGDVRLSGWSKTTDEIPDPELVTQISDKLFYYVQPGDARKSARHPWLLTKAMGRFDPSKHPRGQPENAGEFTSGGGGGASAPVSRHNPDLDAAFAEAPDKLPAPPSDIRGNGPDIFDPQPTTPRPGPSKPGATGAQKPSPKAAALTRQFRDLAAQHARQGKLAGLNGDKVTAKRHRMIAAEYRRVAGFHSLGEHGQAEEARRKTERLFGLDSTATPPELPQRAPSGANSGQMGSGTAPAPTAPQTAPQRSQGPAGAATPHDRTMQTANAAANMLAHLPPGAPPDVRRVAHQQAVAALDAHLKAGLAELRRRASKGGFRGGNMYRKAAAAFKAKLSAARKRIDEMAGRGPPPVPGAGQRQPAPAERGLSAGPPPLPRRGPPPLPSAAGRQLAPWVPLKAFHPWLMVAKAGHDVSGQPRDEAGRFASIHGAIAGKLGWDAEDYKAAAGLNAAGLKQTAASAGVSVADLKAAIAAGPPGKADLSPAAVAALVHAAAKTIPDPFGNEAASASAGNHKVYVADLYDALKGKLPGVSLDDFKAAVFAAHQAGHLNLGRSDMLPYTKNPEQGRRSEIVHPHSANATFHLVNVPVGKAARPWLSAALDLSLPPVHPWLVFKAFNPNEARDDKGQWTKGGPTTALRLRSAIAHVSTYSEDDISHHYGLADRAVAELKALPQPDVYRHLKAAGLEGIKPSDSKKALLLRLHNRITAGVRARLRNEV